MWLKNSILLLLCGLCSSYFVNALETSFVEAERDGENPTTYQQVNSIKRYLFSLDAKTDLAAEFVRRNIKLTGPLKVPTAGQSSEQQGVGGSGIPGYFLVDHSRGQFHVYALRQRPQHPVAPMPYVEQEVVFDTPNPAVSPVGTFTYPTQGGPFPAVLLIAGSGAHNRDGNVSLHKTMLVLADHLTRQGFAVLRYDKRGVGLTGGEANPLSIIVDYSDDALAAVRFLQAQPQVNAAQLGLAGHSEGGIIAAMVAAKAPEAIQFIALLAGPGLVGIEVKTLQDAAARRADGLSERLVIANQQQERELFAIAASTLGHRDALAAMAAATEALPAELKSLLEVPREGIPNEALELLLTPWFRHFLALDPRTYLRQVKCPVLAIVGEKDLQVPPTPNLAAIKQALTQAGNRNVTVVQMPNLNHLLQTAQSGKANEYFLIEHTIAPDALALVSNWMQQTIKAQQIMAVKTKP